MLIVKIVVSQVTKVRDPITGQLGLLFQVHYPEIKDGVKPRHRFMSSFEQHVEVPDRNWQYLLVSRSSYLSSSYSGFDRFPSSFLPYPIQRTHADTLAVLFMPILVSTDRSGTISNDFLQDSITRNRQCVSILFLHPLSLHSSYALIGCGL